MGRSQPVAEGHELIDFVDDAALLSKLGEGAMRDQGASCSPYDSALARRSCSNAIASVRGARSETEGALDDPGLADNAALEGEHPGLALAQRAHHLEALDRGVGRLQRLEPAHGPDQQLELAVVGLDKTLLRYFTCLCLVSFGHLPSAFSSAMAAA